MLASDSELLGRYLYGKDRAAFEELVRRHSTLVMNVCRTMLLHREDSEDAFQATFLVLSRKASSLVRRNSIAGWLYHVAVRNCLEARRLHGKKGTEVMSAEPVASDNEPWLSIAQAQDCELIHREIDKLPGHYRDAILVCHVQGHSREEAAELLNKSESSIKAALARGRNLLRQRLIRRGVMTTALLGVIQSVSTSAEAAVSESLILATLNTCTASNSSAVASATASSSIQTIAQNGVSMSSSLFIKGVLFAAGISFICLPLMVLAQTNQNAAQKIEIAGSSQAKTEPMPLDVLPNEKPKKKSPKITDTKQFEITQSEDYWKLILRSHQANLQNIKQKLAINIEQFKSGAAPNKQFELTAQIFDIEAKLFEANLNIERIRHEKESGVAVDPRRIPPASTSVLRPGEVLELKSLTDSTLNDSRVVVQADHTVTLALVGTISVQNMSPDQLRTVLNKEYGQFVRDPSFFVRRFSAHDAERNLSR